MRPPFQRLLDDHGPDILRFCVAAAGPQDAEDCFQETFLSALRTYPSLRDTSNLRGWLFTIAARKITDEHRARVRRPAPVERLREDGYAQSLPDPSVWRAVRGLPAKQRACVVLRHVCDLPYAEIAGAVGCSEDAARQNVRAGSSKLREVLR